MTSTAGSTTTSFRLTPICARATMPLSPTALIPGPAGGISIPASFEPYGVRVPTFVVSPWVRPGEAHIVLDHCSILKTILACFCGDSQRFLSDRVHASRSFESFLTEASPRLDVRPADEVSCAPAVDPKPADGRIVTPPFRAADADEPCPTITI